MMRTTRMRPPGSMNVRKMHVTAVTPVEVGGVVLCGNLGVR